MVDRLQPCTPNTPDSPWAARRGSKTEAQIMNDLRRMSGDFDSSDGDSPPSDSGDDVTAPHIEKRGTRKIRRSNSERGWDRRSRRKKQRSVSGSSGGGSGGSAGPRLKDVGRQDSGSNLLERRLQRGRGGGATDVHGRPIENPQNIQIFRALKESMSSPFSPLKKNGMPRSPHFSPFRRQMEPFSPFSPVEEGTEPNTPFTPSSPTSGRLSEPNTPVSGRRHSGERKTRGKYRRRSRDDASPPSARHSGESSRSHLAAAAAAALLSPSGEAAGDAAGGSADHSLVYSDDDEGIQRVPSEPSTPTEKRDAWARTANTAVAAARQRTHSANAATGAGSAVAAASAVRMTGQRAQLGKARRSPDASPIGTSCGGGYSSGGSAGDLSPYSPSVTGGASMVLRKAVAQNALLRAHEGGPTAPMSVSTTTTLAAAATEMNTTSEVLQGGAPSGRSSATAKRVDALSSTVNVTIAGEVRSAHTIRATPLTTVPAPAASIGPAEVDGDHPGDGEEDKLLPSSSEVAPGHSKAVSLRVHDSDISDLDSNSDLDGVDTAVSEAERDDTNLCAPDDLPPPSEEAVATTLLRYLKLKPIQFVVHTAAVLSLLCALFAALYAIFLGSAFVGVLGSKSGQQGCWDCMAARVLFASVTLVSAVALYACICRVVLFKLAPNVNLNHPGEIKCGICWCCLAPPLRCCRSMWPRRDITNRSSVPPLLAPLALLMRCYGGGTARRMSIDRGTGMQRPIQLTVVQLSGLRAMARVLSVWAFFLLSLVCVITILLFFGVQHGAAQHTGRVGVSERCASICGCDAVVLDSCSNFLLSFVVHALVVSLPYLYLVLFKFSRDLTEEAGQHAMERIASTGSPGFRAAMGELELVSYKDRQHRQEMRRAAMDLV